MTRPDRGPKEGGEAVVNKKKTIVAAALLALLLTGCGKTPAAEPAPTETVSPAETPVPEQSPDPEALTEAGRLCLSEIMSKNRAALLDGDGAPSDWIELYNRSDEPVALGGWALCDKAGDGWALPERTLGAGERLLVFASGKDRRGDELHTDFSLSDGETLRLVSPHGLEADRAELPDTAADCSLARDRDGTFAETRWPTPGEDNTAAGYERCQSARTAAGPLVINEVMVANFLDTYHRSVGEGDWVELKNISDETVELSDYYLSDDPDNYHACRLPSGKLAPGALRVLRCDADGGVDLLLSLDDSRDRLYLCGEERVLDYVSLHDVPLDGSCGRRDGEGGFFYFATATPGRDNKGGERRVGDAPTVLTPGGCYDGVESVEISLAAAPEAVIRYTLDGTVPTADSALYEGPLTLEKTGILRAVAFEPGALPSRAATESYFLNEGHDLPVISLVVDDYRQYRRVYENKIKHFEMPGSVALYEADGSFSIGCGVTLSGATSLELPKKNLSVRFRGAYGDEWLDYDVFDGGVTSFRSLTIRSGQDYYYTIIRDELCQDIGLELSDHLLTQRSKFCALYVNGNYRGLYALKEKITRQFYASTFGVSRESVTMESASVRPKDAFYQEVYSFVRHNDMTDESNYAHVCDVLDIDSLIDWAILEGYFANHDLQSGNLRYCKSSEGDGKWRLVYYDLDSAVHRRTTAYSNLYGSDKTKQQISGILRSMLRNPDFKARLCERTAEALRGPLASDHVLQTANDMLALIEQERLKDFKRFKTSEKRYQNEVRHLREFLTDYDAYAVKAFCDEIGLSKDERSLWFSDWLG